MTIGTIGRRKVLTGVAGLLAAGWGRTAEGQPPPPVIRLGLDYALGQYFFDPIGLYVPVGTTVRWQFPFRGGPGALMGCSVTAFHPSHDNHELRIPESARPFDSGPLNRASGGTIAFEWRFDADGTYDYFSAAHEILGMAGRIVVGAPGGPAARFPPGYGAREGRAAVFPAELAILNACPSDQIVAQKAVPYPRHLVTRPYPFGER